MSDGTQAGTHTLGDLVPGRRSSVPTAAQVVGSLLFFDAWTPEYGRELWAERLAPECGNGVLDAGEACDDGATNRTDACCSAACQVIDGDHDGKCDRDDPCTAGAPMRARLRVSGGGTHRRNDGRLWISGHLENVLSSDSGGAARLNPAVSGMRIILRSRTATVLDALIPPGYARNGRRSGWRTRRPGREWTYSSNCVHAPAGIRGAVVRRSSSRSVTVSAWGSSGAYELAPEITSTGSLVELTVTLDPGVLPSRRCGNASFDRERCHLDRRANTISCR